MEYVLGAQSLCDFLWIGITMFDATPANAKPLGRRRERPTNNPLSFFERISMIRLSLLDRGITGDKFGFIPFPIETPQLLTSFLPIEIPCFTTVYDQWNQEKIQILEDCGYEVVVLWERDEKTVSGEMIRRSISERSDSWREMVPRPVEEALDRIGLDQRLHQLQTDPLSSDAHRE